MYGEKEHDHTGNAKETPQPGTQSLCQMWSTTRLLPSVWVVPDLFSRACLTRQDPRGREVFLVNRLEG
jgi:hypothetical protein